MKQVSVVIVSYFTGPILFETVKSVANQESVNEIIFVNNGNPPEVLSKIKDDYSEFGGFKLIDGHGNIGFARACNLGASKAECEYLLFLNPDCVVSEGGIHRLLELGKDKTEKFILAPHLVNWDGSNQRGGRREILTPWIALVEGLKLYKLSPNHPYFKRFDHKDLPLPQKGKSIPVTSGACMFMKKSVYSQLGGMDEAYFLHVEDVDLCMRLRKAGGRIYFCPEVTFLHALGTSKAKRIFIEWHKQNGFRRYFRVHFKGMYPPGFIAIVNGLLILRFCLIAVKEMVKKVLGFIRPLAKKQTPYKQDGSRDKNRAVCNPSLFGQKSGHRPGPGSSG